MFRLGVWLALVSLAPVTARAANYYVNDASTAGDVAMPGCAVMGTGVDTAACGTCGAPCRTLQYAYDQKPLTGGDTVYLNSGTYTGTGTTPVLILDNVAKQGVAGVPLTFAGPTGPDGRAALDGVGVPLALLDGQTTAWAGVSVGVPGIRLESFGITRMGNVTCSTSFSFCGSAIRIFDTSAIRWFEFVGVDVYGLPGVLANAIDVDQAPGSCSPRCLISNNRFHNSPDAAQAIYVAGLSGVEIAGNEMVAWSLNGQFAAIEVIGTGAAGASIHNNVIAGNGSWALLLRSCPGGTACVGAVASNVQVFQNTFRGNFLTASADPQRSEVRILSGTGHVITNNIIQAESVPAFYVAAGIAVTYDFNGYSFPGTVAMGTHNGTSYTTLASWQAGAGQDLNSRVGTPLFVSATDSHLQSAAGHFTAAGVRVVDSSTSPFLDAANPAASFALERAPHGERADLGAYGNTSQNGLTAVQLVRVSGDGQTGTAGAALALPFAVGVSYVTGGAAASGVRVAFLPTVGGGSASPTPAATTGAGQASAVATLGAPGPQQFQASLVDPVGAGVVTFTATALAGDAGGGDGGSQDAGGGGDAGDGGGASDGGAGTDAGGDDAGGDPRSLSVACGCGAGSAPEMFALALALVAAARVTRRWRRGPSPRRGW